VRTNTRESPAKPARRSLTGLAVDNCFGNGNGNGLACRPKMLPAPSAAAGLPGLVVHRAQVGRDEFAVVGLCARRAKRLDLLPMGVPGPRQAADDAARSTRSAP
jgi:hypothetical protein